MRFLWEQQKPEDAIVETHEEINIDQVPSKEVIASNNEEEHQLSLWHVLQHHKGLVWWCFFFAVSAIGWYVQHFLTPSSTLAIVRSATRQSRGSLY